MTDREGLERLREEGLRSLYPQEGKILVGTASCGLAAGGREVLEALSEEVAKQGLDWVVAQTGCLGFCSKEPLVEVRSTTSRVIYPEMAEGRARELVRALAQGDYKGEWALCQIPQERTSSAQTLVGIAMDGELDFYKKQLRLVLQNCGLIDPARIEEYVARGGYQALDKALGMEPEAIIEDVKRSGLRGRGGAGFPTGFKWELCRQAPGEVKYLICNADEGDPGAYMDRSVLEGDPHAVIEGMTIGAYAIGATEGFIYVRAEYPLAVERLRTALAQARQHGFLGKNILDNGFDFDVRIFEGAGAFVCGEETALIASIEGRRGMPRPRPPFPAQSGLWNKPTNINNVETWANVPLIIAKGADWYAGIGTEKSKGTKVFSLVGKVANTGLVEVPMGTPLGEIIYDIGGGIPGGKAFKAVQTGGPSGGCIPASLLNLPVDYERLSETGSIMGSGGMVVMDEDTCPVDLALFFLNFTQKESCGKCAPCRLGTKRMLDILEKISRGEGTLKEIDRLEALAKAVKAGSLCGLGQTAPNPVLTTIRYFRDEYEEHLRMKRCRAAACKGLVKAPCIHACPAGIDVPRYVRLIAAGRFEDALAVVREKIPFPAVCGLVCFHPCEAKCRRAQIDEAIAIRALKRAAAERDDGRWKRQIRPQEKTGKRVAIVGAGPAGLTAGYYLARKGHSVTVYDALPEPGGMMRYGIPEYRLPHELLDREIAEIEAAGVEIFTNARIESIEELLDQGFDAVFLALGAHRGAELGIEGEEEVGVLDCIDFLRRVKLGHRVDMGERVAVVGGGNAAIDAARTALRLAAGAAPEADQSALDASRMALRLGAKEVTILYRRSRDEMPASPEEVREALVEGVRIEFLTQPLKISKANGEIRLDCMRMRLGDFGPDGRRRPEPLPESEFSLTVDRVITAIGETPEIPSGFGLSTTKWNTLPADPVTLETERPGVFAGGDVVSGPASVIDAIAAGRRAASSIDRYLGGNGSIEERLIDPDEDVPLEPEEGEKARVPIRMRATEERLGGFGEVELGYTEEEAMEEAKRCLSCDREDE